MNSLEENVSIEEVFEKNLIKQDGITVVQSPSWCTEGINNNASEFVQLDYLAKILVELFLDKKENERNKSN